MFMRVHNSSTIFFSCFPKLPSRNCWTT